MSNYAYTIHRSTVDHEAAGREMRAVINSHADSCRKRMEAAEARRKRQAQRDTFVLRTCLCVIVFAVLAILCAVDDVAYWLAGVGMILCVGYLQLNAVAYFTRNRKAPSWNIIEEG